MHLKGGNQTFDIPGIIGYLYSIVITLARGISIPLKGDCSIVYGIEVKYLNWKEPQNRGCGLFRYPLFSEYSSLNCVSPMVVFSNLLIVEDNAQCAKTDLFWTLSDKIYSNRSMN